MAEQSFKNHAHRPTPTTIVWLLALVALGMMGWRVFSWSGRDWALALTIFAVIELGYISRVYIVALQDRIIMLEMKVRIAELLPAGEDLQAGQVVQKADRRAALCV